MAYKFEPPDGTCILFSKAQSQAAIDELTSTTNGLTTELPISGWFNDINQTALSGYGDWNRHANASHHVYWSWRLQTAMNDTAGSQGNMRDVATGSNDAYILACFTQFRAVRSAGRLVWVRPFWEWNGSWGTNYPWQPYSGGTYHPRNSPTDCINAFRRVVIISRGGTVAEINTALAAAGLSDLAAAAQTTINALAGSTLPRTDVAWVWCPHRSPSPGSTDNYPELLYPGQQYVDWVGCDIYSAAGDFTNLSAVTRGPNYIYDTWCGPNSTAQHPFGWWELGTRGTDGTVGQTRATQLFDWCEARGQVKAMTAYNHNGNDPGSSRLGDNPLYWGVWRDRMDARAARYIRTKTELDATPLITTGAVNGGGAAGGTGGGSGGGGGGTGGTAIWTVENGTLDTNWTSGGASRGTGFSASTVSNAYRVRLPSSSTGTMARHTAYRLTADDLGDEATYSGTLRFDEEPGAGEQWWVAYIAQGTAATGEFGLTGVTDAYGLLVGRHDDSVYLIRKDPAGNQVDGSGAAGPIASASLPLSNTSYDWSLVFDDTTVTATFGTVSISGPHGTAWDTATFYTQWQNNRAGSPYFTAAIPDMQLSVGTATAIPQVLANGYSTIGSLTSTIGANWKYAMRVSVAGGFPIDTVQVYLTGGTSSQAVRVMLCQDTGTENRPGTILAVAPAQTIAASQAGGWVTFTLSTRYTPSADEDIWIAIVGGTTGGQATYSYTEAAGLQDAVVYGNTAGIFDSMAVGGTFGAISATPLERYISAYVVPSAPDTPGGLPDDRTMGRRLDGRRVTGRRVA